MRRGEGEFLLGVPYPLTPSLKGEGGFREGLSGEGGAGVGAVGGLEARPTRRD
jgi:hypothetical protein